MGINAILLLSALLTLCSAPTVPDIAVRSISAVWRPRHFVANTSVSHKSLNAWATPLCSLQRGVRERLACLFEHA